MAVFQILRCNMPIFPVIAPGTRSEQVVDTFGGYNHNLKINDGEFYDTKNLTTDYYPLLGNRKPRLKLPFNFKEIYGMTVDADGTLYIVGKQDGATSLFKIEDNKTLTNISANLRALVGTISQFDRGDGGTLTDGEKQLVLFNHKVFVFPDKIAFDTRENGMVEGEHFYGYRPLDYDVRFPFKGNISPCLPDGSIVFGSKFYSDKEPENPTDQEVWVDTSKTPHVFKHYDVKAKTWLTYTDICTYISGEDLRLPFEGLNVNDQIEISGFSNKKLNGTHRVVLFPDYQANLPTNNNSIIIDVRLDEPEVVLDTQTITITRLAPEMDYVVAANNRLWGCRFHDVLNEYDADSSRNEIYACALGNPFSWSIYQGLSTDSYTASCGTPGAFTGATVLNGYPIFFKENYYHKVYISATGAHQIVSKEIDGVQSGCANSVTVIDNICYYKARSGVKAFDGTQAYDLNSAFGDEVYKSASGGTAKGKYYISMQNLQGEWSMFAYDIKRGMWMKENDSHAIYFTSMSNDTFFVIKGDDYDIYVISDYSTTDEKEDVTDWEAVTGLQGYTYTGRKYITRFNLRMMLPKGSTMDVYIEYDSSGRWEKQGTIRGFGTNTFMLPVKPRRCDHFRIKLTGKGKVRIYSFSKIFEGGTDIK